MCVSREPFPDLNESLPTGEDLLRQLFPLSSGVIVQLDLGANLLFVGCGQGDALAELARIFPRSRFAGIDRDENAVNAARLKAIRAGVRNAWFQVADASTHRFGDIFHVAVNMSVDSGQSLPALHRSLVHGGTLFLRDGGEPATGALYDAGFTSIRYVVLPDPALHHVYIARK